jgi:hypothetical protein
VVSFTLRPLYPLDRRLGGHQSRTGIVGEEKNSQPPPRIEPLKPDHPARSQSPYRLSYPGSVEIQLKFNVLARKLKSENKII